MNVIEQVDDYIIALKENYKTLSEFEALQIATKMAQIEAFKEANVTDRRDGVPALEAIAICLGMSGQFSVTITDAISSVAQSMDNVATALGKLQSKD